MLDKNLIENIAGALGTRPGLIEKDWHVVRALGVLATLCRSGLGRTGTIATRLLVGFGITPREAIAKVRQARLGAIQTLEQEKYVLTLPSV